MGAVITNRNKLELLYYQYDFISSVFSVHDGDFKSGTNNRYVGLFTGLGAGKSTVGAFAALIAADKFRAPGCIIGCDYTSLNDSTLSAAGKIWNKLGKKYSIHFSNKQKYINLCGTIVYLRSLKYPGQIAGLPDLGWIWIDEASKAQNDRGFKEAIGRLRRAEEENNSNWPMCMFLTGTPNGKDYIYNFFIDDPQNDPKIRNANNRKIFYNIDSSENIYLDSDYISALDTDYGGRYRLQQKGGQFVMMEGSVWDPYIADPVMITNAGRKVFPLGISIAIDFGFRRPCFLFISKLFDPLQNKMIDFVFDYIMPENVTIDTAIMMIRNRLASDWDVDNFSVISSIYCDPAGDAANSHEYKTEIGKLKAAFPGVRFYYSKQIQFSSIEKGIMAVDNFFRKKELAISKRCERKGKGDYNNPVTALSSVRYPELKPGTPIKNCYVKDGENDHAADCARYWAVWQEPLSRRKS